MHKSKYFDKAGEMAMNKLMPKPDISITISMADGGGLSNLNKTMMIKGQPHKLAWIRPDEASLLKAMGGSGKKVDGIPAYFDWPSADEGVDVPQGDDEGVFDSDAEYGSWKGADILAGQRGPDDLTVDPGLVRGLTPTAKADTYDYDSWKGADILAGKPDDTLATEIRDSDVPMPYSGLETKEQIIARLMGDKETDGVPTYLLPYWNELADQGLFPDEIADRLAGVMVNPTGLMGLREGYYEGYNYGGPLGTLQMLTDNIGQQYAESMQQRLKERDEREASVGLLTGAPLGKETQNIFSSALGKIKDVFMGPDELTPDAIRDIQADFKERGATFTPMSDTERAIGAVLQPTIGKIFSSIVGGRPIGTLTTKDGLTYTVGEGGEITTYPDTPVAVNEGNEPIERRKRKRVAPKEEEKVTEKVEETESFPTGRREASLEGLQNIYQDIYGRKFRI